MMKMMTQWSKNPNRGVKKSLQKKKNKSISKRRKGKLLPREKKKQKVNKKNIQLKTRKINMINTTDMKEKVKIFYRTCNVLFLLWGFTSVFYIGRTAFSYSRVSALSYYLVHLRGMDMCSSIKKFIYFNSKVCKLRGYQKSSPW